jgi:diacylglycerol kinase (ATP)
METAENEAGGTKFSFKKRLKSFRAAFNGIAILLNSEHNARIHLAVLIFVILAGLILGIKSQDWIAVGFAAGLVFVSECFNTAIEYLSDVVSPDYNNRIRRAKDVAAAGVLIAAIISVLIGIVVFLPAIIKIFPR